VVAASAAGASNGGGGGGGQQQQQQQHAATFAGAPAFSREHVAAAMSRVVVLGLRETLDLRPHLHAPAATAGAAAGATVPASNDTTTSSSPPFEVTAYYAGHVLGACMFHVRAGDRSVFYTGDHSGLDAGGRHLAAARLPPAAAAAAAGSLPRPPDLCISESTYASSVRGDGGRAARERALLDAVERAVRSGGRALFPVYAVGRAQELMALVERRWRRRPPGQGRGAAGGGGNFQQQHPSSLEPLAARVPVYAAGGMAARASAAYRLLAGWAAPGAAATEGGDNEDDEDEEDDDNRHQQQRFVCSGSRRARAFRFPLVRPLERAGLERLLRGEDPSGGAGSGGGGAGPCVLFASPGTLGGGASLAAFRAWAPDPRNLVVLPSYQVAGTLGCRLLAGETRGVELPGGGGGGQKRGAQQQQRRGAGAAQQQQQQDPPRIDVRCQVRYAPFSAHADASGLLRVLDAAAPRAVALVHGDRDGMDFLAARLRRCPPPSSGSGAAAAAKPFPVFCPKTGEEVVVPTDGGVTVLASRAVLDRAAPAAGDGSGSAEEPPDDGAGRLGRALERALARENFGRSARLDDAVLLADRSSPEAGVRLRLITLEEAVREVEGRLGGGKEAAAAALSLPAAAAPPPFPPPPVRVGCYVPFLGGGVDDPGQSQLAAALEALSRAGVAIAGTSVRAAAAGAGRLRVSWLSADAALGERCARVLSGAEET
jgi:Cft2 family RNA processing exonuclease